MWETLFRRWLDLMCWWMPGRREEGPATEAAPPERGAEGPAASPETGGRPPTEARAASAPEDLTVIKGIGPVMQERLRSLGIAGFRDLAAADPDKLAERLRGSQPISRAQVRGWVEAARERTGADG